MGIHRLLISGLKAATNALAGEEIEIQGKIIPAIIDEEQTSNVIGLGTKENDRTLVVKFRADLITNKPKSGDPVKARDQRWQISSDPDAIRIGKAATTIILVDPNRRES